MTLDTRLLAVSLTILAICIHDGAAQDSRPTARLATQVKPIDPAALRERIEDLADDERTMIRLYLEAARREVLKPEDGCFPVRGHAEHCRNLAERAKGAAVLSSLEGYWPEAFRRQVREKTRDLIREVAMTHRATPSFNYEWQAAFWASEAAIAAWFLWDELDADLRDAVAEMVVFQADRFIDKAPKMGFQGNTEAETVSWDSSILTLAVNMMPQHPHQARWDQAAKRYLYNTFAVPQDARNSQAGDDDRQVRDWIVGANLYPDFTLENHGQFHIDYVLACYRFHIQGAAMYGLTGRPLPQALRHHARDVYEKILLPCTDGEGFFVYVSDNDWKRYHPWAESCSIHAYIAMLEQHPLAAALERRALGNAFGHWRVMPEGFAFDNPYVCGKAWTSRVADAVLLHLTRPKGLPTPLPDSEVDLRLAGTARVETADLLSHYSKAGSLTSWCKGKGDSHIRFVAPRNDAWMLLPIAGNYEPHAAAKPLLGKCQSQWKRGPDWFWIVRRDQAGCAEAFVSLPDSTAIYVHHIPKSALPASSEIVNPIAVEKPFAKTRFHFESGQAVYTPSRSEWQHDRGSGEIAGNWVNLQDQIGWVVQSLNAAAVPSIRLPDPGKRGQLSLVSRTAGNDHVQFIFAFPNQEHVATQAMVREVRCSRDSDGEALFTCRTPEFSLILNMAESETVVPVDRDHTDNSGQVNIPPRSVLCWRRDGSRLF